MDFSSLKQTIDANIIGNGTQNITGDVLNAVLTDMIEVTEQEIRTHVDNAIVQTLNTPV